MRILLVTDWPALEGGIERYVELLRDGLVRSGDDVRLLTSAAGSAASGTAEYVAHGSGRRSEQAVLQVWNPFAARAARRAVRDFRPDAVHINMVHLHLSAAVLAPLRDVPSLIVVHDYKPVCPTGTKVIPDGRDCVGPAGVRCRRDGCIGIPRLLREVPRNGLFLAALQHVDRVQTLSRWLQGVLRESGIEAELEPPPVSLPSSEFARRPAAEPLFVYAGRLAPVKGVDVLLRAFARLRRRAPGARLRIAGDGPEREALRALIGELGLADSVALRLGMDKEWFDELEPAWALVAPSVYREPFGLVAAEAIARGVPVIASDGGGLAETVRPGSSGLLVPGGDERALAEAMLELAERRCFADHAVAPEQVELLRRRHDPTRHAERVRATLASLSEEAATA